MEEIGRGGGARPHWQPLLPRTSRPAERDPARRGLGLLGGTRQPFEGSPFPAGLTKHPSGSSRPAHGGSRSRAPSPAIACSPRPSTFARPPASAVRGGGASPSPSLSRPIPPRASPSPPRTVPLTSTRPSVELRDGLRVPRCLRRLAAGGGLLRREASACEVALQRYMAAAAMAG